ncbi:MAG: methyltransferase [Acidobacteria bacterium]|nr:methyltransferase [Acidobacteriota bacterium]
MKFKQPANGYRYSIDAFLLAFFASRFQSTDVIEFGCGCGIVSLLMAARYPGYRNFELFEIQPDLCSFAKQNIQAHPFPGRNFTVRCEDVRYALPMLKPGLIVCNPPFRNPKSGRIPANRQKAVARNWFFLPPPALFEAFIRMRRDENAALCLILSAENISDWLNAAENTGLAVTGRILVHPSAGREPQLLLVKFGSRPGSVLDEHLVLAGEDGRHTEIVKEIMGGI